MLVARTESPFLQVLEVSISLTHIHPQTQISFLAFPSVHQTTYLAHLQKLCRLVSHKALPPFTQPNFAPVRRALHHSARPPSPPIMAYGQPLPSLPSDPKFDNIQSLPTCPVYSVRGDEPWITSDDMGLLKALIQRHSLTRHNGDTSDMEVKSLPPGCKLGKMVGEGAANAVFEVHLPDGSQLTHQNTRMFTPFYSGCLVFQVIIRPECKALMVQTNRPLTATRQEPCGRPFQVQLP